jgi:hypothetical protein
LSKKKTTKKNGTHDTHRYSRLFQWVQSNCANHGSFSHSLVVVISFALVANAISFSHPLPSLYKRARLFHLSQALLSVRQLDPMVSAPEKETGCGQRERMEGRMVL